MNMIQVDSTNIDSVGYDEQKSILIIQFLDGSEYEYVDVPEYVYLDFLDAPSKGKYAHENIYDVYRSNRIR